MFDSEKQAFGGTLLKIWKNP